MSNVAFELLGRVGLDHSKARRGLKELDRDLHGTVKDFEGAERASSKFFKGLNKAAAGATSLTGGGAGGGLIDGLADTLKALPGIGTLAAGVLKVGQAMSGVIQKGFDYNKVLEDNTVAFGVMLKSQEKAKDLLTDLAKLAEQSPFEFPDVIDATKNMMALGYSVDEIKKRLLIFSDTASALGVPMERIILALGQMRQKGKVSFEEMNQLVEAGVPGWKYLADALAQTDKKFAALTDDKRIAAIQKMAEAGRLSAKGAEQAISIGMQKQFGGIGQKIATETAHGLESNLNDVVTRLLGTATSPFFEQYKSMLRGLLSIANSQVGQHAAEGIAGATSDPLQMIESALKANGSIMLGPQVVDGAIKLGGFMEQGIAKGLAGAGLKHAEDYLKDWYTGTGTNSPSKEFIPLGVFAAQGFKLGFDQEMGGAAGVMDFFQTRGVQRGQGANLRSVVENLAADPRVRAMLDTISYSEGAGYGTHVGHRGDRDPNSVTTKNRNVVYVGRDKKGRALNSSADGRYQFINGTWDGVAGRLGLTGFTPHEQDLGAVLRLLDRGAIDPLMRGDFRGAVSAARQEWASFPGAGYAQGERSIGSLERVYNAALTNGPTQLQDFNSAINLAANRVRDWTQTLDESYFTLRRRAPDAPTIDGGSVDGGTSTAIAEALTTTSAFPLVLTTADAKAQLFLHTLKAVPGVVAEGNAQLEQTIPLIEEVHKSMEEKMLGVISEIGNGFEQMFVENLMRLPQEGFAQTCKNLLLQFTQMLEQMALQAGAAQIGNLIFGTADGQTGQRSGGWLSKLLGIGISALGAAAGAGVGHTYSSSGTSTGSGAGGFFSNSFYGNGHAGNGFFSSGSYGSIFHRATGGNVRAGGAYIVNEREQELFLPGVSGSIQPASKFGGHVTVNMTVQGVTDARSFKASEGQLGRRAGQAANRAIRRLT